VVSGASIETTLELWASALREVKARMRPLFQQERMAVSTGLFLDGLLGEERRKTGWMRAEAAGDPGPWRQQSVLGRGRWDADALRDIVRDYAVETLADADAVLVIDETGFLKQGKASCGVARQYTGSAGKITNCQVGVFAAYVSRHGPAFIDRLLYLPKAWTNDPARLLAAHVPKEVSFATKPRIAVGMIKRALAAKLPFTWVAADTVYGVGEVATCSGWQARIRSAPGAGHKRPAARPGPLPRRARRGTGSACPLAAEPRGRACTIGAMSNSPILPPVSTAATNTRSGHAAC